MDVQGGLRPVGRIRAAPSVRGQREAARRASERGPARARARPWKRTRTQSDIRLTSDSQHLLSSWPARRTARLGIESMGIVNGLRHAAMLTLRQTGRHCLLSLVHATRSLAAL